MGFLDYDGLSKYTKKIEDMLDRLLSFKQNSLIAGKGLVISEDIASVETPIMAVKKAEYEALSESEKYSGLYIITDVNAPSTSGSEDVYSTEETRIGTWIDGKPLYRKVCNLIITASSEAIAVNIDIPLSILDKLVNQYGSWRLDDGSKGDVGGTNLYFNISDKWYMIQKVSSVVHTYTVNAVFEYTKTTDIAPVSLQSSEETNLTSKVDPPTAVSVNGVAHNVSFQSVASSASSVHFTSIASAAVSSTTLSFKESAI